MSFKNIFKQEKNIVEIERSALIINRGWIPASLRDKRTRITEINQRKLVKVRGVFRAGKDIHSYSVPNNPDNNEWHNISLEDMGTFWDLPNYHEAQYYYFQCVDGIDGGRFTDELAQPGVEKATKDEVIDDHYGFWVSSTVNKYMYQGFGAISAGLCSLAFLAL